MLKLSTPNAIIAPFAFEGGLHCDNSLASSYFNDFADNVSDTSANLMFSGRNGVEYVVLFENEAQKDEQHFNKSYLRLLRKCRLVDLYCRLIGHIDSYELTKPELIDDLMTITHEKYYRRHYADDSVTWYDLEHDYVVCGYSQGDAVAVKDLSKSKFWTEESLCNIFYDSPLSGKVTIYQDEQEIAEIYFDEYLDSLYATWDSERKDALIESIMKHHTNKPYADALREYLSNTIPDDYSGLDYVD